MHRFFVSSAALEQQPVILTGDLAHQMRRVLRLRLGERVTLLDGQGWAYEAIVLTLGDEEVRLQTVRRWPTDGEPRTHVTLCQALLKGDRFAWALQKGTEVGVSTFVPLVCERNVVDDLEAIASPVKRSRWERIIREAAEQCGRGRLPELAAGQLFGQAVQPVSVPRRSGQGQGDDRLFVGAGADAVLRLIAWEGEHTVTLRQVLEGCDFAAGAHIWVFIGPEGGFTEDEIAQAQRYGVQPVTLGPRILRAETAGVIAAALILYAAGDL